MSDDTARNHPGLEELAGLSDGRLDHSEAEIIREHVNGCSDCRLEIKRLQRFETIETDEELADKILDNPNFPFVLAKIFTNSFSVSG